MLLVHMGSPAEGEQFFADRWPEARAVSDPDKIVYGAFGLARGSVGQLLGPGVWRAGWRAFRAGHGVGRPVGDPLMMSGWFLVRAGRVVWSDRHEHAGTERPYAELIAASASN